MKAHGSSHANSRQFLRRVTERWRLYVFAVLCILSVLAGLFWYQASKPINVPFPDFNPTPVNVYVSDPAAAVTLGVTVYTGNPPAAFIHLAILPPHPNEVVDWLITLERTPVDEARVPAKAVPLYRGGSTLFSVTTYSGSTSGHLVSTDLTGFGTYIGGYDSDLEYRYYSNGSFQALPPLIELNSLAGKLDYVLELRSTGDRARKSSSSEALVDLTTTLKGEELPVANYIGGPIKQYAFYVPTHLNAVVKLSVGPNFADYQPLQTAPALASLILIWVC